MEDNIVKNTEEVEGVRSHVGFTVIRPRGHKLIVGNGFVWDAREEKLYGDPSPALHWFGGDEENDPGVRKHYCDILRFVRGGRNKPTVVAIPSFTREASGNWKSTRTDRQNWSMRTKFLHLGPLHMSTSGVTLARLIISFCCCQSAVKQNSLNVRNCFGN